MCGIGGIFSKDAVLSFYAQEKLISDALHHRGPDGKSSFSNQNVLLVHTLLSIMDTSGLGLQPFYNEGRTVISICNGEIYNHQSLKSTLIQNGHLFNGKSDCEIIPHLYEEYGVGMFKLLEGMFAVAVYDIHENKLLMARDRFGIKPLYYMVEQNTIYFGSELKAILCHPHIQTKPDWQAIHDFLSLCYIPEPATGFQNIHALPPSHYLMFDGTQTHLQAYTDDIHGVHDTANGSLEKSSLVIEKLLSQSVTDYMVADVPMGAFLSGGIDSAVVVKTMQEHAAYGAVLTFTAKFNDKAFDESALAKEISDILGTQHNVLLIDESECTPALMEELLSHFDQPYADSSAIPMYLISRKIREHVKVGLSGEGGDEVFAGYSLFLYMDYLERISNIPRFIRTLADKLLHIAQRVLPEKVRQYRKLIELSKLTPVDRLFRLSAYQSESEKYNLYNSTFWNVAQGLQPTSRLFWFNHQEDGKKLCRISQVLFRNSLLGDMFKKVDMMSMKAALEVRVPLMQEALVKAGLNLPDVVKIHDGKGKRVLRHILKKKLPARIVDAPKSGFAIPLDRMLTHDMCNWIREKLCSDRSRINQLLNAEEVNRWVEEFLTNKRNKTKWSREGLYQRIFMLLSLEIWMRKYNITIS
jgi:asparagine synthase (glutamine-hydrolysing)